jgi:hypothetical protein
MKSGLDNKRNVAILVGLLVLMLVCVIYFVKSVFVGGSPAPQVAAAPAPAPTVRTARSGGGGHEAPKAVKLENLDPTLHPELMAGAESLVYSGSGRNIFSMASAPPKIEKVEAPIRPGPVVPPAPAGPPPPPAIDLKFFGYEAEGGAKKAFILHGDDVFIASEGDVVDHHYKILKINPLSIQVTDLLYNNTQTLPLTQS